MTLVCYKKSFTDFRDKNEIRENALYGLDTNNQLYIEYVVGILYLSSREFKTCDKNYIKKKFDSFFAYYPTIWVKTNKLKEVKDYYVVIKLVHDASHMTLEGTIEKYIGPVGEIDFEEEVINSLAVSHWRKKIDKMLPQEVGIVDDDITPIRTDLSHIENIVSIDPEGCLDIDDALSIEQLSDHTYRIGVHIADPSSFLMENSPLDCEVMKRTESIYLKKHTIHMFHSDLSTRLFSLRSDMNKVRAFSVMMTIEVFDGAIITKSINVMKSLVRIKKNMSYDQFQELVDKDTKEENILSLLYKLGRHYYTNVLDPLKLIKYDAKKMVEIFMILANCISANKLLDGLAKYKDKILIRSQKISTYTSQLSDDVESKYVDMHKKIKLSSALIKLYSDTDLESNVHHSLNLNLASVDSSLQNVYTHFTSPIRRYSDIIVHRLLYNVITNSDIFQLTNIDLKLLFHINHNKAHYRKVVKYENLIDIIRSTLNDCTDRVIELNGIIIDISNDDVPKIKIICEDDPFKNYIFSIKLVDKRLIEPGITKVEIDDTQLKIINQSNEDTYKLFGQIKFRISILMRSIEKIKAFI